MANFTTYSKAGLDSLIYSETLCNRMTVHPSKARKASIRTFIGALLAAGVWDKLDGLYVPAAHDAQAGRLNWVRGKAQDLVAVNSPAFVVDRGFTGDGATSYLDPGLVSNAAERYSRDSAFMAFWTDTVLNSDTPQDVSAKNAYINSRTTGGNQAQRVNYSGTTGVIFNAAVATSAGLASWSRQSVAGFNVHKNGAVVGTSALGTEALDATPFYFLRSNSGNYSSRRMMLGAFGGGLTDTQVTAFYSAALTYMQSVGAA